jgi:hypothetical protein
MTNKSVQAKVCWLKEQDGGRKAPPPGPRYSTVARFGEEEDKWPQEAWSLVLEFSGPPDESLCMIADVSLLNPDGPTRLLHPGSIFELFEGRRLVARGEVL